jgi:hypothetical protein
MQTVIALAFIHKIAPPGTGRLGKGEKWRFLVLLQWHDMAFSV